MTVDGCFSSCSPVLFGVPHGAHWDPTLIIHTFNGWFVIQCSIVAYADDTTKYAVIPSPQDQQKIIGVLTRGPKDSVMV